ncbi:MAG: PIN domain-containing protein, partial [Bdellovibrionota bacterium]
MAGIKYLLDTHALIWAAVDEDRLGTTAARAIAQTPYGKLAISDVTLQEVGLLLHSDRITVQGSPA